MASKQVRSAYEFIKRPTIACRRGPEFSFTRASASSMPIWGGYHLKFPEDVPLWGNANPRIQLLTNSEDLSHADWAKDGLTVAKDATDPHGNPNSAWTLTEDTSVGLHSLSQAYADFELYQYAHISIWVNAAASNARYVYLSTADLSDQYYPFVVDLVTKRIVDNSYFGTSEEGVTDMGNGWIVLEGITQLFTDKDSLVFGITDSPTRTDIAGGYTGDGSGSVIVWHPAMTFSGDLGYDPDGYTSSDDKVEWLSQYQLYNYCLNSGLRGYGGKGTPPDGFGYSPGYGWSEVGAGGGDLAASTQAVPTKNPSTDPVEANAVRCYGTNTQYYLAYDGSYGFVYPTDDNLTLSIFIEDITVAPSGNIIDVSGLTGVTGTTTADINDMDADGWVSITFSVPQGTGLNGSNTLIGLGVSGNDTGDFTWSSPMITEGSTRLPYVANNGDYYYGAVGEYVAGYRELDLYGLYIAPEAAGLLAQSNPVTDGGWTTTNVALAWANIQMNDIRSGGTRFTATGGGSGASNITKGITTEASKRYTVTLPISPYFEQWYYLAVTGMASQSIYAYYDVKAATIGGVGADAVATIESTRSGWARQLKLEFVSDAVDTSAVLEIHNASADGNLVVPLDGNHRGFIGDVNVIEGSADTIIEAFGTPVTRAADVMKRTDISDVTSEGVIDISFRTWSDVENEDKTLWSISDGSADDRMELRITGGNLQLVVVDGGVSQVAATGSSTIAADTEYRASVYYKLNDFQVWLDGTSEVVDTSGTLPAWTQMNLGSNWNDVEQLDGFVREFKVYSGDYSEDMAAISGGTYTDPASGIECEGTRGLCRPLIRDVS